MDWLCNLSPDIVGKLHSVNLYKWDTAPTLSALTLRNRDTQNVHCHDIHCNFRWA